MRRRPVPWAPASLGARPVADFGLMAASKLVAAAKGLRAVESRIIVRQRLEGPPTAGAIEETQQFTCETLRYLKG